MLVVLLCCMMKLVEISAFASSPHYSTPSGDGGTNLPPPVRASRLCPEGDNSPAGSTGRLVARKKRRRHIKGSGGGKTIILGNKSSKNIAASKYFSGSAVAMTGGVVDVAGAATVGVGDGTSPADSDFNSNPHHHNNISCLSDDTSSHQDIEFIQDNQDYQWFLDYGYRDNNHASILSLAESYEAGDLGYYDTLAKNMDANLAEADIESFRTEDIHALLTNLPPMCTDQLSQENNRQGESYASISNSLLGMHFTNSHNSSNRSNQSNTSSQSLNHLNDNDYSTMSICKSELLFSPVKEAPEGGNLLLPLGGVNFSVDSLDCDDLMLTCQNTNMENYTIAFEGSGGGFDGEEEEEEWEEGSEEHGYQFNIINQQQNTQSLHKTHIARLQKKHNNSNKNSLDSMTQSDSGNLTTWSKLKKINRDEGSKMERHPSGNNNQATVDDSTSQATLQLSGHLSGPTVKSQSMPNLYGKKVNSSNEQEKIVVPSVIYLVNKSQLNTSDSSTECPTIKRKPVRVFNIQHQSTTSGTSGSSVLSEMATSVDGGSTSSAHSKVQAQQNFSLVKLFMKQKSISAEGMSTGLDEHSSICENWNFSTSCNENKTSNFEDSLLQTNKYNSATSEIVNNKQQFMEKVLKTTKINNSDSTNDRGLTLNLNSNYKSSSNNNNNASLEINDYNTRKMQHQKLKSRSTNTKRNGKTCSENQISSDSSNSSFTKPSKFLQKHFPIHLMNKSIQTSTLLMDSLTNITNKPAPYKLNGGCQNNQGYVKRDKFKVIEPSFLSKLKKEGEIEQSEKPVYVLYPNYVLPNLDFLNEKNESTKVILLPQKPSRTPPANHRPVSCNDLEALLKRGGGRNQFSHIRDWDSLLPLLPQEYQQVLAKVPDVCNGGGSLGRRKQSATVERTGSCNSSSSGYRGSSTILSSDLSTPSSAAKFNPLFVYRYDSNTSSETSQTNHTNVPPMLPKRMNLISGGGKAEVVPPRPPLPRGILRRGNNGDVKMRPRYSMFEMTEEEFYSEIANKRRSLQEPYHGMIRNKRLSETEDEGVDAGTSSSSLDSNDQHFQNQPRNQQFNQQSTPPNNYQPQNSILFTNLNHEDLRQLEDFLQQSNNTSNSSVDNNNTSSRSGSDQQASREIISDDLGMLELRSQVSRFLALRINQCQEASGGRKVSFKGETEGRGPNNSPLNVSCMTTQRLSSTKPPSTLIVDMPDIHEESTPPTTSNPSSYHSSPRHTKHPLSQSSQPTNSILKQQHLITTVTDSVERVIHEFSAATNQPELDALGDSARNPSGAKVALTRLCPALYAVLSDGLKGVLETSFGPIGNSVWQVVEASAQQGPLTKALNDLVMRINAEDVITEGLVKFNAFVFGLLNVRSLDAWLSYLRTRESVLRKHYDQDALLVKALMGGTEVRQLLDSLIATVQPLALLPFQYDLLFEYRLLHESLKKMDTYQQQLSPTHQQFKPWKANNTAPSTDTPTLPDLLNNSTSTTPPHLIVNVKHTSNSPPKVRPRSYVDNFRHTSLSSGNTAGVNRCNMDDAFDNPNDIHGNQPRRWSGISANNKLFQAYSKLEGDEEYMDSLEEFSGTPYFIPHSDATNIPPSNQPESLESNASLNDEKPLNGRKFKKLQRRWELLSGTNTSPPESPCILPQKEQHHMILSPVNANPQQSFPNLLQNSPSGNSVPSSATACKLSKIPRPVTSPVKPISGSNGGGSSIPVLISPQGTRSGCKKVGAVVGMSPVKKPVAAPRTSRLDQLEQNNQETRTLARPSSLPYKPNNSISKGSKITPPRRAISTSVNRKGASGVTAFNQAKLPKTSRTE